MDEFDEIETGTTTEAAAPAREVVPEGTHEFRINSVANNVGALEMELVHDDARFFWVDCKIGKTWKGWNKLVGSLARSFGMTGPQLRDAIAGGDITGRRVAARIWHKTGDRGVIFANVGEFRAVEQTSAPPPATKSVAKRTATQKADAASAAVKDDDIPF